MTRSNTKYIIAGAGLSGLTTAYHLLQQGEKDFLILEGRDRIGGRIWTEDQIDLGATWFQDHHTYLSQLIDDLGLPKFRQYSKGKSVFIYSSMAPAQYFEADKQDAPSAYRIGGGSVALINALAKDLVGKIKLNTTITAIIAKEQRLSIHTNDGDFTAEKIVLALPPQIGLGIQFSPVLPAPLVHAMTNTHTWMSNAIKVGIWYKRPFWRDKDFSGTIIGHVGPVIEIYDHSNQEETHFSLMGFVNEGLRDESAENRKERILAYLEKYLGSEARDYIRYQEKDWSVDQYTASEKLKSVYISPRYGNPLFQDTYMDGKLLLSGAETAAVHGGYMDGAIYSGKSAAFRLLK